MECIQNKKLIWWRDVPIDVEIGLVAYLSAVWNNDIYIISVNGYEIARKQCSWDVRNFDNVHIIVGHLDSEENKNIIKKLLNEDNIHIFSGIRGGQKKYLDILNKKNGKCIIIAESTSLYGSKSKLILKRVLYSAMYRWYCKKYQKIIKAFCAMGKDAARQYMSYGWEIVFDFMYLPELNCIEDTSKCQEKKNIKMLYIGRFDYPTKGVDILMQAIDNLEVDSGWTLDLVGGYGNQKKEVIEWCQQSKNVQFIGSWDAATVVENMANYDFCVVPSICDGWNLTPLQAIHAGIGCIVTDHAGSQELVHNSGAGLVVEYKNSEQLKLTIQKILENQTIIEVWKEKARAYITYVSKNTVGNYFLQILKYSFGEIQQKPECPW